jgi:hypothetical protein
VTKELVIVLNKIGEMCEQFMKKNTLKKTLKDKNNVDPA